MMNKFSLDDLKKIYSSYWRVGYGSIAADEVLFIQSLINQYKPRDFLEVGMASGLSGGLISQLLEWNQGKSFTSIDHDATFFGDKTKENGFLMDSLYKGSAINVEKKFFFTTPNLSELDQKFQMAFIDANHQQPWPLIDTLCMYPYMEGDKIMIHHDLNLYQKQSVIRGIGPKYLFDQFPEKNRLITEANFGNIFALKLGDLTNEDIEDIAIRCFYLPWTNFSAFPENLLKTLAEIFAKFYSQKLVEAFTVAAGRFNDRTS